jgi:phosphopantothenoylcysteine synthetase/decarboxylase
MAITSATQQAELGPQRLLLIGSGATSVMYMPALVGHLRTTYSVTVNVALTAAARRLASPAAMAAVCGGPIIPAQWSDEPDQGPLHVSWAAWPDMVVVWPATLGFLTRCATGLSNDVPTAIVLSTHAPVIFAPSLPAEASSGGPYRRAAETLQQDGHHIIGPVTGTSLADLSQSQSACAPPETLLAEISRVWSLYRHAPLAQRASDENYCPRQERSSGQLSTEPTP